MKKSTLSVSLLAAAAIFTGSFASCDKKEQTSTTAKPKAEKVDASKLPNYRYVDMDSVLSRYNLAKDYNEEMLRMQNNADATMKKHQTDLQSFASQVQNKMQNNGYMSEASYKQDEQKMADMQANAQRSAESLQNNLMQAQAQATQALDDSIKSFIDSYNKEHGYDAILWKSATLYINPALDITDEVIEGLNARYNKVSGKTKK